MLKRKMTRRHFICKTTGYGIVGIVTTTGLSLFAGCDDAKEEANKAAAQPNQAVQAAQEAANPCTDLSALSTAEMAIRDDFEYVSRSVDGTELCRNCTYWRPSPRGDFCGGCTLMKGPIHPLGTCDSWEESASS